MIVTQGRQVVQQDPVVRGPVSPPQRHGVESMVWHLLSALYVAWKVRQIEKS